MSKVVVTTASRDSKEILIQTSKDDLVSVRLEQRGLSQDENGFVRSEVRTDFAKLPKALAEEMVGNGTIKVGTPWENVLGKPCKIVIKESTEAFYPGQPAKINPTTKQEVTKDGQPIYRKGFLTFDMEASDVLVKHDVVSANVKIAANTDFDASKA